MVARDYASSEPSSYGVSFSYLKLSEENQLRFSSRVKRYYLHEFAQHSCLDKQRSRYLD